jgi:hypothetical protein
MGRTAKSVATGSGYGFTSLDDGSIGRWGDAFAPYAIAKNARVKQFDRGPDYDRYHICAAMESGVVSCWPGYPYYGELSAYGTLGPNYNDALPPESRPVIALGGGHLTRQVATGSQHSCALLDDDTIKCWGRNDYGQLGIGDTVHRGVTLDQMGDALPVVQLGEPAKAVAAGAQHTCAILKSGNVKCWGYNDAGQLGQGRTDNLGDAANELASLPAIDLGTGRTAVAIDVGTHSCALLDNGAVKCWGSNLNGELGQGDTAARGAAPGTMGDALHEIDLGE